MTKNNSDISGLTDLISQMGAISKALHENLHVQGFASSMLKIRQQLIDSMEPVLQSHLQTSEMLRNLSVDIGKLASPLLTDFHNQIENIVSPAFKDFLQSFRLLPEHTQAALMTLGKHGWFFDLKMPLRFLWELESALNEGEIEEAELALVEYFRENLSQIENRFSRKFPHRTKIISAALNAHKRGEYELAVPVFLAQTDGICYEVIKQHLFMRENKKPRTAIYVDTIASNTFRRAILSPLSNTLPISASKYERDQDFDELNRHQILHGESLDYGTEINSLKAISLLNYVVQVLRLDDKDET